MDVSRRTTTMTAVATVVRRRVRRSGGRRNMGVVKWIVGMGYWMQGFRVFPTMGIDFFIKDVAGLSLRAMQLLESFASLPALAKPVYGLLSDAVPICGQHRLPYVAIGTLLQVASWMTLLALPEASFSVVNLVPFVLIAKIGTAMSEVATDAIVAEIGKQSSETQKLQLISFTWITMSFGSALGNLVGGAAINRISHRAMLLVFILLLVLQFLSTVAVHERSLDLPKKATDDSSMSLSVRKKITELSVALCKPEISSSIAWFFLSTCMIPEMNSTMFYFNTQHLRIHSSTLGISRVVGQGASIAWTIMYCKQLKEIPARKLLSALQVTMAVLVASNVLFVKGFFRALGMPDALYVVTVYGVAEEFAYFKNLPFMVLMAEMCPKGCEGSLTAFLMSSDSLAYIISRYLGVGLAWCMGISGTNFAGLPVALSILAACTLLPTWWSSWVPDTDINGRTAGRNKHDW